MNFSDDAISRDLSGATRFEISCDVSEIFPLRYAESYDSINIVNRDYSISSIGRVKRRKCTKYYVQRKIQWPRKIFGQLSQTNFIQGGW